jgi:hypothetical protein
VGDVTARAAEVAKLTAWVAAYRDAHGKVLVSFNAGEHAHLRADLHRVMSVVVAKVGAVDADLATALELEWFTPGPEAVRETDLRLAWAAYSPVDQVSRDDVAAVFKVSGGQVARWCGMPGAPQATGRAVESGALAYRAGDWARWRPARVGRPTGKADR